MSPPFVLSGHNIDPSLTPVYRTLSEGVTDPAPGFPSFRNNPNLGVTDYVIEKSISTQSGHANGGRFVNTAAGFPAKLEDNATGVNIQNWNNVSASANWDFRVLAFSGIGACAAANISAASNYWPNRPNTPGDWVNAGPLNLLLGFVSESVSGNGLGECIAVIEIRFAGDMSLQARFRQTNRFIA